MQEYVASLAYLQAGGGLSKLKVAERMARIRWSLVELVSAWHLALMFDVRDITGVPAHLSQGPVVHSTYNYLASPQLLRWYTF